MNMTVINNMGHVLSRINTNHKRHDNFLQNKYKYLSHTNLLKNHAVNYSSCLDFELLLTTSAI